MRKDSQEQREHPFWPGKNAVVVASTCVDGIDDAGEGQAETMGDALSGEAPP
jgi:hypothetical protein